MSILSFYTSSTRHFLKQIDNLTMCCCKYGSLSHVSNNVYIYSRMSLACGLRCNILIKLCSVLFKIEVLCTWNCFVFQTSCTCLQNSVKVAALAVGESAMVRSQKSMKQHIIFERTDNLSFHRPANL